MSGSENMSAKIDPRPAGPVTLAVPSEEYRCGTCFASHASTCCGVPGASHQSALSTRSGVPGIWIAVLSAPESADGEAESLRAPDGTANEARMASASVTARCSGPAAGRGFDRVAGTVLPTDKAGWPTVLRDRAPGQRDNGHSAEGSGGASGGAAGNSGAGAGGERARRDRR